jgi:uncharacterized NAD-dependent epimerase/dehydratase family protein
MESSIEWAVVYCEGAFNTPNGKTAHGLVRFTERYQICAVLDSRYLGSDAGMVLDGRPNGIPVMATLNEALIDAAKKGTLISHFIVGLAPDGGRLPVEAYQILESALKARLNLVSGLHDFLSDNERLVSLATKHQCDLMDIRKPPDRSRLHFFSGKIQEVTCPKIAVLGTDSAIGKRTTAWHLVHAFRNRGHRVELIGTGQTAWLQGARYSIVLDSLVNDFVSGEIEHAVHQAWKIEQPELIIIEGQGSLLNPAYPGGYEIIAAGRPDFIILQHAPRRKEYDGFPGYPIHELPRQIAAVEIVSGRKVIAITVNHEGMAKDEIAGECDKIRKETGLPAFDTLEHGADKLAESIKTYLDEWQATE